MASNGSEEPQEKMTSSLSKATMEALAWWPSMLAFESDEVNGSYGSAHRW
jgi:hypothetical protein